MMTGLGVLAVLVLAVILRPLLAYQAPTRMSDDWLESHQASTEGDEL
jgi:hypothetical protein